jgi:hypothetical protein
MDRVFIGSGIECPRPVAVVEGPHGTLGTFVPAHHVRRRRLAQQIIEAEAELIRQGHVRLNSLMRKAMGNGWRSKRRGGRAA